VNSSGVLGSFWFCSNLPTVLLLFPPTIRVGLARLVSRQSGGFNELACKQSSLAGERGSGVHFMSFHLSSIRFALAISIMSECRERVARAPQVFMQKP